MSYLRNAVEQAARAKRVVIDHFGYNAAWTPLGASATTPVTIPISADSDFMWMETTGIVYSAAGVLNPAPDLLIAYADTGAGRNLQDNPVHYSNVVGNGQWPFILPEPKLLVGNGSLQITLTNNVAVAQTVRITIVGIKIFYLQGYDRSALIMGL